MKTATNFRTFLVPQLFRKSFLGLFFVALSAATSIPQVSAQTKAAKKEAPLDAADAPMIRPPHPYRLLGAGPGSGSQTTPTAPDAVNNYSPARTTGITYSSISGTGTSVTGWRNGNNTDDNLSTSQPIGFTFIYNGNAYTQFLVSTNGFITFNTSTAATGAGSGATAYSFTNAQFSSSTNSTANALAPFYDDQQTAGNLSTLADLNASIKYQTTGVAGSRVLTVEWINFQDFATSSTASLNYQVKLYEVDGHIEYVYGTMTTGAATWSYTLGINAAALSSTPTAAELLSQQTANTATFSNTASNTLATIPATNSQLTFTPPAAAPTSPGSLATSNVGASALTLSWVDNSANELGFVIYISTDNITFTPIGTLPANSTTINITGLSANTTYYFQVTATTEGVQSPPSNTASATTAPPVSGTKTIGPGGDYTTFTAAINDANAGTGAGGVIFNVAAGAIFVESPPCITGGSVTNPITFQKSGAGANPIIQPAGTTSAQDSGICILGGDYITVNGIDIAVAAGVTTVEYGYLVFNLSATNGSQNNMVQNSKVTLDRTNTGSIGINQTLSTAATAAGGANSNNRYYNVTIENASRGILLNGTSTTILDTNNEIGVTGGGKTTVGSATANDIGNGTAVTYGIQATSQFGVKIFGAEVRNVTGTGTGTVEGISLGNSTPTISVGTCQIYNNVVHDIKSTSTSTTSHVVSGIRSNLSANAGSIARIYNNFVYGLDNPSTIAAVTRQIIGLRIQDATGGGGATQNIHNNSVRLAPTGIASSNANIEIGTASGPVMDVRNNIFANFTGAQSVSTALHYTWVTSSTAIVGPAGSVSNFNDLYVANSTNGHVGRGNTTNYTTLANWQAGVTQDANSISLDPLFFSVTDLHLSTTSPAINLGTTIAAITDDIDAQTRPNGAAYDIGADEFYPSPGTVQFSSTTYTVAETGITATITATRAGGSNGAVSVNYATVAGGSATGGGACGGSVDYVPTSGTLNWGDLDTAPKTFTVTVCSDGVPEGSETVNLALSGAVTAALGTPNTAVLTITNAGDTFTGSVNVGVGQTYTTLTSAVNSLNAGTLTGPTTLLLTDSSYPNETFPLTINALSGASSTNTVTIKPSSGVSPTITGGAASTCVINLNGADFVTIDGSNTVGGTTKDLTLVGGNTSASAVVCVSSLGTGAGATNDTIKNTNLVGAADTSTSTTDTFGIFSGGNGTPSTSLDGLDNDNNTFDNNAITKMRYGIYVRGASANTNDTNTISRNTIGSTAFNTSRISKGGIVVQHQNAINVTQNEIRFVGILLADAGGGTDRVGIGVGDFNWTPTTTAITNATVTRNSIHDIIEEKTFSSVGIILGPSGVTATNNLVANNMIYNVRANGTSGDQGVGIGINSGDADKVVFNSVSMTGDIDPVGATTASVSEAGIRIASATATNLTFKNNVMSVDQTSNTSALKHYAFVKPSATYSFGTGGSDQNDYFVNATNPQMVLFGNGTSVPYTDVATLGAFQAEIPAHDPNSKNAIPLFVSGTDLHLQTSSTLQGMGISIGGVTTDFDGQTRPATPDIGADEILTAGTVQFSAANYPDSETNATHPVTITVTRTGGADGAASVHYATSDGTATVADNDYVATAGDLNWTDGETAPKTFTITVNGDTTFEPDETVNLTLSAPLGVTIGTATPNPATLTILNDDPVPNTAPTITAATNVSRQEGSAASNSTIAIVNDAESGAGDVTVTVNGGASATNNGVTVSDIVNTGGTVTATVVAACGAGDATFTLTASDGSLSSTDTLNVSVSPNTPPALTYGNVSVAFGGSATNNPVTGPTDNGSVASIAVQSAGTYGGSISVDNMGVVSISGAAPVGTHTITIRAIDNCGGVLGTTDTTFTITVTGPSFAINDVTLNEGDAATTSFTFTVTKTGPGGATVAFTTQDGTATTANNDYQTNSGTLTFAGGDTTQTITVLVNGDTTFEPDEVFNVQLSNAVGATISDADGTGTIVNDDCFEAPANMVAWYAGEDNTNDIQGPTFQTGSFVGAAAYATGEVGRAFSFNTSNFVTVPAHVGPLNITGSAVTIDGWINPSTNADAVYFGKTVSGGNSYLLLYQFGNISAIIKTAAGETTVNTGVMPPVAQWSHIALTYDGSNMRVYLNGVQQGSAVKTGTISGDIAPFNIGGRNGGLRFNGRIDEVEVFDRALSLAEIQSIFAAGGFGKCKHGLIQFSAPTYTVSESGTAATITVRRTDGDVGAVSAQFDTSNGTATAGSDYNAVNTFIVNFADGDTADKTVPITITSDALFEGNETVNLALSNPTGGAQIGPQATAVLTITDDDSAPSFSISDATVTEGNTGTVSLSFTVSNPNASAGTSAVDFATSNGTATAPSDYQANSGTLNFAPGQMSQVITVAVNGDTTFEANETLTVTLSNPSGGTISDATGAGTITNDDTVPTFSFSSAAYSVNENTPGTVTLTVNKSGDTELASSVAYSTTNGSATAPADYDAASGTLNFAAGETSKTFTVTINDDTSFEGNENFTADLSDPMGATLGAPASTTVTINDDDSLPLVQFSQANYDISESGTTVTITVTKTGNTLVPATVMYATSDGTATAGQDYTTQSGTVTFAPGSNSETFTVPILTDTIYEGNEFFNVTLTAPAGAALGSPNPATVTILEDDAQPSFAISDVTQAEGNAGTSIFSFTVTKTGSTALSATVDYTTANGTATTADGDYNAANGTLTFAPGDLTMQVDITVNGDTKFEQPEDFTVNLTMPTNATITDATGLGTITNDDGQPTFTIDDVTMEEGDTGATNFVFTVTKNGTSGGSSTVDFATMDGTATAGSDYVAQNGTLTFTAAQPSQQITIVVNGDTAFEADETFTVNLSDPVNNRAGESPQVIVDSGTGTILNDDLQSTITVTPAVTPTATDNDYTRINNAVQSIAANGTITLSGTFNWTEPNAAASWASGSDYMVGTLDDYSILVPDGLSGVTFTAANLGAATIQGPGDLPTLDLEGVFFFDGGTNTNWTISNIQFFDFDLTIGMVYEPAGTNNFTGTQIVNNFIRMAVDADIGTDFLQNLGILYSFGTNQLISGNTIDIPGNGVGGSEVAMQSNSGGGTSYDGLQITNNLIRVLNAQSATPEFILGIWENGNSSSSNITVSGNSFVNLDDVGNNPALNSQLGFEVTSHSSATSTALYANNTVSGANQAMDWYPGLPYANYLPVQLTNNTFTGNANGVLILSQGQARLTDNTITGIGSTGTGVVARDGLTTVDIIGTTISNTGNAVVVDATNSGTDAVTMRITNSTLSGNNSASGGALTSTGNSGLANTTITNSTLTNNSPNGAGIRLQDASLTVGNSIFNAKTPGTNILALGTSLVSSLGYNLSSDAFGGFLTGTNDLINLDPMLGPLKDNGGPTLTHAPLTGSPAIDQGRDLGSVGPAYPATGEEQRGNTRPQIYNDPAISAPSDGDGSDIGAVELADGVLPIRAESRKDHGDVGTFKIPLALNGPVEVECRSGGPTMAHRIVILFASQVNFSGAAVTNGTGVVQTVTTSGNEVFIDLTGVTNAQRLTVGLFDVDDGATQGDVGVRMGLVLGDTTGNGAVSSSDISQTKAQSGHPLNGVAFRNDVNANGTVNSTDIGIVKSESGAKLPPTPETPDRQSPPLSAAPPTGLEIRSLRSPVLWEGSGRPTRR